MPRRPPRLTVLVSCAVEPQTAEQLRALAEQEERSLSWVMRKALSDYIEQAKRSQEAVA